MNIESLAIEIAAMKKEIASLKVEIAKPKIERDFLFIEEVASYLGMKTTSLYQVVSKGQIPYHKINGKRLMFMKSDIDEWIKNSKEI